MTVLCVTLEHNYDRKNKSNSDNFCSKDMASKLTPNKTIMVTSFHQPQSCHWEGGGSGVHRQYPCTRWDQQSKRQYVASLLALLHPANKY